MRHLIAATTTVALLISGGAFATPIAGLYNTGVGPSGLIAAGSADTYYTVSTSNGHDQSGNSLTLSGNPYVADSTNSSYISSGSGWGNNSQNASGQWIPAANYGGGSASNWLTPTSTPGQSLDPTTDGNYVYTTTFSLTQSNYKTATLQGLWAADNYGTVTLNGNLIGTINNPGAGSGSSYNNWNSLAAVSGDFVSGTNTLVFDVTNIAQTSGNPTGLRAEFTSSISPVPEPETYAMMLAGLALLGAIARRRKTC